MFEIEEKIGRDTFIICLICGSCCSSMLAILIAGYFLCVLEHGRITEQIEMCERKFITTQKVARFAAVSSFC